MSYQGSFAAEVGVNCLSLLHDTYSILSCPLALKLLSFASRIPFLSPAGKNCHGDLAISKN